LPETKTAEFVEGGAIGGKFVDPVEVGGPTEGLPPPVRWARAEALKVKMSKV
jgi:hypothetical protein